MLVEAQAAVRLLQGVLFATVISVAFPIIVVVDCRSCRGSPRVRIPGGTAAARTAGFHWWGWPALGETCALTPAQGHVARRR
jgi:hypothetical protein